MTSAPLTAPTSASAEPPSFLPPAGDFCQQRQKSPKTPLETAFQDFLTRVGYDFALTCPTRNRFSGFSRFKGLCLHSFPRCAVARRCPLPRRVPWCSTARVPADIPSRRTTLSAPHDRCAPYTSRRVDADQVEKIPPRRRDYPSCRWQAADGVSGIRRGGLTQAGRKRSHRSLRSRSSPRPVPSSVSPPVPYRLTPWDPTG